ncbi:MAG: hypothetical protein LBT62_07665 [Deltaproteobacteria bacterium]|jgi:two-component system sensor histidine kinase PilS (NtrC family)|nr:hypothetical protein [Deltaproteobacteria bacterium]
MQWFPETIDKSRLKWLFVFRLVTNSFISVLIILIYINGHAPAINLKFWAIAISIAMTVTYGLTMAHYFLWPRFLGAPSQVVIQMVSDILQASVIIILTGGCESTLNFVFIIVVINSVFLGGLRFSFVAATLSTLAWAGILDLHYYGYLPGLPALGNSMGPTELALNMLVNTGASYLVAILGGHLSSQLDISSRALVTSQTSLNRLSELNENIIHSISYGLITTDNQGRILSINSAGRNILKVSTSVAIGKSWRDFFPELDVTAHSVIRGLMVNYLRPVDKAELLIELSILELTDLHNESWGKLLVIKDQTAFSQMEAEIKRSEHMAAVGRLAAGLAHEIRTPLASMTGSWHMLLSQNFNAEDQNRMMLIIGREMERLETLVDDFLSFAKPSVGHPQALDLNSLINDQVHIFKTWKGAQAKIELSLEDIPMVYFDTGQLCQVIFNLIQNALDAAVADRLCHVTISTSTEALHRGYVTFTISDNGVGISEDNIKRIFEPFFTTKSKGTGLGLAMVWGIISNGNGRISVRSTPDVLTSFTILFPVYKLSQGELPLTSAM